MKRFIAPFVALLICLGGTVRAQVIPWLSWSLLPQNQMDEIIGETSGETAWKTIASLAAFNRDRRPEEFKDMFLETKVVSGLLRDYGLSGVEVIRYAGTESVIWDAKKGELWEVKPRRQKIASFNDMVAALAAGSTPTDATAELVWVGKGTAEEIRKAEVKGKIAVTEGNMGAVHREACVKQGALGVVAVSMEKPFVDPLQIPWSRIDMPQIPGLSDPATAGEKPRFGFTLSAREGARLKQRLLAGERITVRAQIVAEEVPYRHEDIVAFIPGTDPEAEEIIFTAHLFEGTVKQGANDNLSGCACILETARVLNTLIAEGRLPRPKRTIRFLWAPEYEGTGKWVQAHPDIMKRTLCNINMDMVGEWLSRSQAFFCLMRTTYGMPHYINDVMENYFRFVGEGSRDRVQNWERGPLRRITAPFGADEPMPYSIEWHFGSSDHGVFNDWSVGIPGVSMNAWPDFWYHTSSDTADKSDPTQLKRAAVIGAAAAYTIASADDTMAVKIASETAANGARRISIRLQAGIAALNEAAKDSFAGIYKKEVFALEAAVANEKETLDTVLELASNKKKVAGHISRMNKAVDGAGSSASEALQAHMEAAAERLGMPPVRTFSLSPLEAKAAKIVPRRTEKVRAEGYMDAMKFFLALPKKAQAQGLMAACVFRPGISDLDELRRLIDGKRSILEIKRILDAQAPGESEIPAILDYLEILKAAGFVEMN